ncbi:putative F-box domain-containing protein [Medicago truncatula]|uniref:F-box protein n=1 Tax=Medicago truncatula TaxID=3880 RepID=G7KT89_MEDTR|nr:uncharacterized protein LOC120576882 [Medicago truncatula]AES79590.1 F-box protein [Medicago truncatula]RHN46542.1 putative F-box domain-containing protein [Medicago truncatula]
MVMEAQDCQLPPEMLDIISKNLDFDDLFQFAGVCKSWREFHKIYCINFLASQAPLIFQTSSYSKDDYSFYSIPNQRAYRLKMGSLWGYSYSGSSSGYLIMAGDNDTLLLINPFRRRKKVINTSVLRGKFSSSSCRALLAFAKGSKEFVVVVSCTSHHSLHVYQSRDSGWVTHSIRGNPWNVVDFVVLHNTIHLITDKADIGILNVNSTNIKFLELNNAPSVTFSRLRLVSCDEQLLVVHFVPEKVLDVYKIDFSTMNYEKLETLGDVAFFYSSWTNFRALRNPSRWGYESNSMYCICLFAECHVYSVDDNKLRKHIVASGSLQTPGRSNFYWLDWCFPHLHDEVDYSLVK